MLGKLLGKSKKKRVSDDNPFASIDLDESIDLDSGTIYIDDTVDESKVVQTTEVFQQAAANDPRAKKIAGGGGKVFLLDLNPFFKSMGTRKGDRAAQTFTRFCENWLSRQVAGGGAFELVRNEIFFFRLNLPNKEAGPKAVEIVNSIGQQYLRDAFNANLVPDMLGAVDEDSAMREGQIDPNKAMMALEQWRKLSYEQRQDLMANAWETEELPDDSGTYMVEIRNERPASVRVIRGPERRQKRVASYAGQEKRRRKYGRRASDNPRNGAAWK
jgi:hypothetical protein